MSQNNHQETLYNEFEKELNKYQVYLSEQYANIQSVFQAHLRIELEETPDLFFSLILADNKDFFLNHSFSDPSFMIDLMKCMASGFTPNQILYLALEHPRRDQFIDLALTNEIDFNNIYALPSSTSVVCLEKCMNHGLSLNNAVQLILNSSADNDQEKESQAILVNFIAKKGANFSEIYYNLPSYFADELYELLLKQGLKLSTFIESILQEDDNDKLDRLLNFAISHKADFNSMSYLPALLSVVTLEKLLEYGLTLNNAAKLVSNYSTDNAQEKELQIKLVNFLLEKNANFQDVYSIPIYFPYETYETLLKHGLKASILLQSAFAITDAGIRAQLIDLALKNKADFNSMISLPHSLSIATLEEILEYGLTLNNAVKLVSNYSNDNAQEKELQIKLVNFLLEKNANFQDVYSIPIYFPYETYETLLKHGLKASILLQSAFAITDAGIRAQLIDLALSHRVYFDSIYSLPFSLTVAELEKFLKNGLTTEKATSLVLTMSASTDQETAIQINFLKSLVETNVNFNNFSIPQNLSYEIYEILLQHGLKANTVYDRLLTLTDNEQRSNLVDLALNYKIDFGLVDSLPNALSKAELEKYLANGLSIDKALSLVLDIQQPDNLIQDPQNSLYNLIELLINKGADINSIFIRNISSSTSYTNGHATVHTLTNHSKILVSILELLIKEHALNPNKVLEHGLMNNRIDSVKLALKYNADITTVAEYTLNLALHNKNMKMVVLLNEHGAKIKINLSEYIEFIKNENFSFKVYIAKTFADVYNQDKASAILRYNGASELDIKQFFDLHNLVNDYILAKNNVPNILGTIELEILDNQITIANIEEYKYIQYTNKYGYQALHLAIIADRYDLAERLIKADFDAYTQSHNHMTPLQLFVNMFLSTTFNGDRTEITRIISEVIGEVDIKLDSGQTLADRLISNTALEAKIIEKSKDPLFYLFKPDADLFSLSQDTSKTHIAISHGASFWSTGIWSTARLITENHPNVKFYLVSDKILARGGEPFFKQFDAVINPGAGDSYPRNYDGFKKEDCSFNNQLERHYQNTLELSDKFAIPYLGICAGAQHFSMYHGGSLKLLNKDNIDYSASRIIEFVEGTLPYYLSLTKKQQAKLLSDCELPKISFSGDRAHSFAAIIGKLGDNMELGAVSGDQVAMSYAHSNGIRYATQYHPEHYYKHDDQNSNARHQKAWLDNFVELAKMHHAHRMNDDIAHPIEHYIEIKARLDICVTAPTCLGDESTYESLFLN